MGGGGAGPGDQGRARPRHGEQRGDQPPQHRGLRRLTQPGNTISFIYNFSSFNVSDDRMTTTVPSLTTAPARRATRATGGQSHA